MRYFLESFARRIVASSFDGRTRDRQRRIAGFIEGDATAFCISLKAGGVGLNLTAADYVSFLDLWWNRAVEVLEGIRLLVTGTIEEWAVTL